MTPTMMLPIPAAVSQPHPRLPDHRGEDHTKAALRDEQNCNNYQQGKRATYGV